jgi:phosphatidylglycerophosphate synthase
MSAPIFRQIPNLLSVIRIPLALAFLVTYEPTTEPRFLTAMAIASIALGSDFLDGFLARKWGIVSEVGYFLDGLGDKAFTVAILLVIAREHSGEIVLAWWLIFREIILYALRAVDQNRQLNIKRLRPLSRLQAFLIRLYFLVFFLNDGLIIAGQKSWWLFEQNYLLGYMSAAVGYASVGMLAKNINEQSLGPRTKGV